jgi:hypothetical protein
MEILAFIAVNAAAMILAHYAIEGIDYVVDVVKSKLR